MKKLFTLLLVLAGCVSTVEAKTIYFIDNWGRTNLQLYAWDDVSNNGWISLSSATCYIGKSNGWHSCYKLDLGNYTHFLIKHDWYDSREKTPDLTSSEYEDGEYYEYYYDGNDNSEKLQKATLYTYTFNVTTASSWENFNIYLWNSENDNSISGANWPGMPVTGSGNAYTYIFRSYINTIKVLFNQGDGQPQTCDMTPGVGENNYYIGSIASSKNNDSWGEAVKTNAAGFSTYVNTDNLVIPAGIAYKAIDNGNGTATASSFTNPEANTPMLIKGNASTTYHFATASTGNEITGNAFVAGPVDELASQTDGGYNYILNGDTFKRAANQRVGDKKAYLHLSQDLPNGARALIFAEDETTGINSVSGSRFMDNTYYDLQGREVVNPTKGLYIVNGKKVVIK